MTSNERRAAEIIHRRALRLADPATRPDGRPHGRALLAARDLAADGLLVPDRLLLPGDAIEEEDYRVAPFEEVDGMYVTRRYTRLVTPWQLAPMVTNAEKKTGRP